MTAELFVGAGVEIDAIAVADVDAERLAQKLDDGRLKRLHHRRPVDLHVQLRLEFLAADVIQSSFLGSVNGATTFGNNDIRHNDTQNNDINSDGRYKHCVVMLKARFFCCYAICHNVEYR
jgi:hypothetical protein